VICTDAGVTDVYAGAVPADLLLVCGVFGNIGDADVQSSRPHAEDPALVQRRRV
jgi:hypothetical protein